MPLSKKETELLRKQYPAEHFKIEEKEGKLQIVPKKVVIRIFKENLKTARAKKFEDDSIEVFLKSLMEKKNLTAENFEQSQITILKETADKISTKAKACKTRKIIYLQRLFQDVK